MKKINVLDKHVAELIAAGEVVERPSSVIKELVENSIDSGATAVTVEIQNGGITMMRVTDNGSGILREDIRNAFVRHATSKVKVSDDLEAIGTLGFRGEALASIAAVAKVDLLTKADEDEVGTHYVIEGCDEVLLEDAGCPKGTTFIIRDLFYNVPARMKFLKKNVSEANAVAAVVDKIALSHSEVAFTFIRDNKQTLVTSGDGNLKNCIYSVFGREFTKGIVPVDYDLNGVTVKGFVTKPQAARASRAMQNFFINGRFVKSRTAMAALEEACKGMVMVGKFPGCVLHIGLSLNAVDVNVHPAKIEVRFVNEKPIFEAVYHGVRTALLEGDTVKNFNMDTQNPFENLIDKSVVQKPFTMSQYTAEKIKNDPIVRPSQRERIDRTAVKNYNAVLADAAQNAVDIKQNESTDISEEEKAAQGFMEHYGIRPVEEPSVMLNDPEAEMLRINSTFRSGRTFPGKGYANIDITVDEDESENAEEKLKPDFIKDNKFRQKDNEIAVDETENITYNNDNEDKNTREEITASANKKNDAYDNIETIIPTDDVKIKYIGEAFSTYIIVEKNNELVMVDKHALHERIIYERLKHEQGKKFAQYLIEPIAVTLSKQQYVGILEKSELMAESGFEIDDFGGSTILVRSAPSFIDAFDIAATVEEMADHILENKKDIQSEYTDWLYHNIACRSAIKGGDLSSPEELFKLYETMEKDPNYRYCPHGRPTSIIITKYQIEKQFGRIQ